MRQLAIQARCIDGASASAAEWRRTLTALNGLDGFPHRIGLELRMLPAEGGRWIAWEHYAIRGDRGETPEIQAVGVTLPTSAGWNGN